MDDCIREKKAASAYGSGCIQKFGVTSFKLGNGRYGYAAGKDQHDQAISQWTGLPDPMMRKLDSISAVRIICRTFLVFSMPKKMYR